MLKLAGLKKFYQMGEARVRALDGIDLSIEKNEFVAVMGPSGSGKSTLMNILGCLDKPTEGSYLLDGREVSGLDDDQLSFTRNKHLGFVFQNFNLLPRTSALENVMMPLAYAPHALHDRAARERGIALLRRVGLEDRMDHEPSQLSGGQQQRVAIARALANNAKLILADEPTASLDTGRGKLVMELLKKIAKENRSAVIVVTHDVRMIEGFDHIYQLKDGHIVGEKRNSI